MEIYPLYNGSTIPQLGFGTYHLKGHFALESTKQALNTGYRLIDTASMYKNEKEIGQAVLESEVPRSDIFVTTKLWPDDYGITSSKNAMDRSLKNLNLDYIDLYLTHWAGEREKRIESWITMEEYFEGEKIRHLGVSNLNIEELEDQISNTTVKPVVNQISLSLFNYDKDLVDYCQTKKL